MTVVKDSELVWSFWYLRGDSLIDRAISASPTCDLRILSSDVRGEILVARWRVCETFARSVYVCDGLPLSIPVIHPALDAGRDSTRSRQASAAGHAGGLRVRLDLHVRVRGGGGRDEY